jgi:hypothetical protein
MSVALTAKPQADGKGRSWSRLLLGIAGCLFALGSARADETSRVAASAAAAAAPVEIIFTGFARHPDKSASIFVRMTAEVPVALDRAGRRLTYRLSGAKLGVANNANPLPTELFGPPVSKVALVQGSGSVDLVIDLSAEPNPAEPTYRFVSSGGLSTLQVDLPAQH